MPLWLLLLIVGVALWCIGRYVMADPPLGRLFVGGAVFCVAVGIILLIYSVLASGSLRLT